MTYGYLVRRLLLVAPTALLASMLVFGVMRALPGDVAATILSGGGETTHSPEVREALRKELGLDDPWPVQYGRWLRAMVDGSFGGDALVDGQPIRSQLARQAPITGLLALYALALTAGGVAAAGRGRRVAAGPVAGPRRPHRDAAGRGCAELPPCATGAAGAAARARLVAAGGVLGAAGGRVGARAHRRRAGAAAELGVRVARAAGWRG